MKSMEPFYKVAQEEARPLAVRRKGLRRRVFGLPADVRRWREHRYVKPLGDVVNAAGDLWKRIPEEQRNITSELLRSPYWAAEQRRAYGRVLPGVHGLAAASYRAGGGTKPYYYRDSPGDEGIAGSTASTAKVLQTHKHPTPLAALSRHMYWKGGVEDATRREPSPLAALYRYIYGRVPKDLRGGAEDSARQKLGRSMIEQARRAAAVKPKGFWDSLGRQYLQAAPAYSFAGPPM